MSNSDNDSQVRINSELLQRVKIEAAITGRKLREVVSEAILEYLEKKKE